MGEKKGCGYMFGAVLGFVAASLIICMMVIVFGALFHIGWNLVGTP